MLRRLISAFLFTLVLAQALPAAAKEGDAAFSVSPDSAFIGLTTALTEAKESIDMNIYMFTSKNIGAVLSTKAEQGVKIRVLVEGEPHGGTVFPAVKQTLDQLNESFKGKNAKLFVMTTNGDKANKRRYVFNHAKYVVVDGKKIFVSSDNFTGSAFPDPSRTIFEGGTRGWQVLLENTKVAAELSQIFEEDVNGKIDVVPYEKANIKVNDPGNGAPLPKREKRTAQSFGIELGRSGKASLCASPKSEKCIVEFIRSAKTDLVVEHLSLPYFWKPFANGVIAKSGPMSPIVTELLAAAKRGVKVKVLVNDDKTFSEDNEGKDAELSNGYTVEQLNKAAAKERLPLEAALFSHKNTQTSYVHNKGMIADGKRVFVSSINGTENSVVNNREIAVAIDTEDGARYFGEVFGFDWENRQK
jgi:phosphatidylserine/phosphatidylglycerophosphate/cardiolipin synthase-like enzyme